MLADDPEQPRARHLRAIGRLGLGNYREGWRDYEYRYGPVSLHRAGDNRAEALRHIARAIEPRV